MASPAAALSRETSATNYPVMFTFKDVVSGNGFLAGVTLCGRALIYRDAPEEWWTDGVHPGGITDTGAAAMEAFANFRNTYKKALFDIAEEAANFDAFASEVTRFFHETNVAEETRWEEAVQAFRSGRIVPEEPFSSLPRVAPEERDCDVCVDRLDKIESNKFSAGFNVPDKIALPKAA